MIDAYGEGLVDKEEFEPRVRAFRERLCRLEAEARQQQELEAQERELRLVIGRLQEFAERVKAGLEEADWSTRREIIRALVKRVEVGAEEVRVVYRVNLAPFAEGPEGGLLPDCRRRAFAAVGQRLSALRAGRVVRAGREAAPAWTCLPDPLCGRLHHGLRL
jgi:site-specific DNA recombinase